MAETKAGGPQPFDEIDGRGTVDYLMRNSQQHLVALSAQADLKANIIITASALLLTVGLTRLDDGGLRVSIAILSAGCLMALVLAILAVLPTATIRSRAKAARNPLFFVDAAVMTHDEFLDRLSSACRSDADIYRLQASDLHEFSTYLATSKYRRLRRAYLAFLAGVVLATLHQLFQAFR